MVWSRDWALFPCMWISYANTICWRECPFPTDWIWFGGPDSKETACNAEDLGPIPGSGRSPGEGIDYLLQYSCLENSMDRGAWRATVNGVTKSWTWHEWVSLSVLSTLLKNYIHRCTGLFLNSITLVYMSILTSVPHCFVYCSFIVSFEIGICEFFNFVLLKIFFGF